MECRTAFRTEPEPGQARAMGDSQTGVESLNGILPLIGRTPLVEIRYRFDGQPRRIFAKYEILNMTGSVKDRMAAHILMKGYESGELLPGDTLVEASSGNTGISFAGIGRADSIQVSRVADQWSGTVDIGYPPGRINDLLS